MIKNHQCKTVFSFVAFVMALLVRPATAAEVHDQLPKPDGKPADQRKPLGTDDQDSGALSADAV